MNVQEAIKKAIENQDLSFQESFDTMKAVMTGEATPAQIACFITALRMKKETPEEIAGLAKAMQNLSTDLGIDGAGFIDTCGTGGDQKHTFNISTASALIAAGAGAKIAKHGNKSVSSQSGSADILAACGVNIQAPVDKVRQALQEIGLAFLFAPLMHKAMKYAIGPRKEIGIRTVFNILGPLTNPCRTKKQIIGVYDIHLVETMIHVMKNLQIEKAYVVHGLEGLDEISISGKTKIGQLDNGKIFFSEITPEEYGLTSHPLETIKGGTPEENAETFKLLLEGKLKESPVESVCVLNAAFAIHLAGLADSPNAGINVAKDSIYSGKALKKLQALIDITNS